MPSAIIVAVANNHNSWVSRVQIENCGSCVHQRSWSPCGVQLQRVIASSADDHDTQAMQARHSFINAQPETVLRIQWEGDGVYRTPRYCHYTSVVTFVDPHMTVDLPHYLRNRSNAIVEHLDNDKLFLFRGAVYPAPCFAGSTGAMAIPHRCCFGFCFANS